MPLIGRAADTHQLHLPLTTLRTYGYLHMNGSKTAQPQMHAKVTDAPSFFRRISAVTAVQPLSRSCTPQLSRLSLSLTCSLTPSFLFFPLSLIIPSLRLLPSEWWCLFHPSIQLRLQLCMLSLRLRPTHCQPHFMESRSLANNNATRLRGHSHAI